MLGPPSSPPPTTHLYVELWPWGERGPHFQSLTEKLNKTHFSRPVGLPLGHKSKTDQQMLSLIPPPTPTQPWAPLTLCSCLPLVWWMKLNIHGKITHGKNPDRIWGIPVGVSLQGCAPDKLQVIFHLCVCVLNVFQMSCKVTVKKKGKRKDQQHILQRCQTYSDSSDVGSKHFGFGPSSCCNLPLYMRSSTEVISFCLPVFKAQKTSKPSDLYMCK